MDREAWWSEFREQWERYESAVRAYLTEYCQSADLAEELAPEVFVRVARFLDQGGKPPDNWLNFLNTVARNVAIDYFRARTRRREWPLKEDDSDAPIDPTANVLRQVIAPETRRRVRSAVARLQAPQRRVVVWRMQGHCTRVIQAKLEGRGLPCSRSTVDRLWQQAQRRLRKVLADCRED